MKQKHIYYIVLLGFLIRVLFYFFGAEIYFGKKDFYIQGDTGDFLLPFINLIEHGSFSVNLNHPEGVFGREPGYSFFLGFFYLITNKNVDLAIRLAVYIQIILDTIAIYYFYLANKNIFNNEKIANFCGFLLATYPFSFLWSSVGYAECLGITCCIMSLYFTTINTNKGYFFSGIFAGVGTLIRPQLLFLIAGFYFATLVLLVFKKHFNFKHALLYFVAASITYGLWPLRNLVMHNEIVLMKRVEGVTRAISSDQLSFAFFMWSVKTDWEPQISQILFKQPVEMPDWVWKLSQQDSIKLRMALALSDSCADGFRQLRKQGPLPKSEDCTIETAKLWKELRVSVIEKEPLKFYLLVPLGNLKKAFFKSGLIKSFNRSDKQSVVANLAKILFNYRSLLLFLGIIGIALTFFNTSIQFNFSFYYVVFYISTLYFWLCFIYRDMDIRYLLPADVLLILPASYTIYKSSLFIKNRLFT